MICLRNYQRLISEFSPSYLMILICVICLRNLESLNYLLLSYEIPMSRYMLARLLEKCEPIYYLNFLLWQSWAINVKHRHQLANYRCQTLGTILSYQCTTPTQACNFSINAKPLGTISETINAKQWAQYQLSKGSLFQLMCI